MIIDRLIKILPLIKFFVNVSGFVPNYPAKHAWDFNLAQATA